MVKKILKTIVNIFTILVFLILVLTIFAKINMISSGKKYFDIFGYSIFKVTTGSMEPTIKQNDIIIVKKDNAYKVNDIVTYTSNDDFITHRIVTISNDIIIAKGDANNASDDEINTSQVIGRVVKILPNMGIWQSIFTTPKIIIALFITLILFDFAFSYKGKEDKGKKSKEIEMPKLSKKENIKEIIIEKEIKQKDEVVEENVPDYTVRLDLNRIQKNISSEIKKK